MPFDMQKQVPIQLTKVKDIFLCLLRLKLIKLQFTHIRFELISPMREVDIINHQTEGTSIWGIEPQSFGRQPNIITAILYAQVATYILNIKHKTLNTHGQLPNPYTFVVTRHCSFFCLLERVSILAIPLLTQWNGKFCLFF